MFILERLISVVAPYECLECGAEGKLVCNWCFIDFCPPLPSRCYKCFAATQNSQTCEKCRRKSPLKHVWVRTNLFGPPQRLLHIYKFERAQSAALILTSYMKEALPFWNNGLIVPVPVATSRLRQRGYDHTKLLAKNLSSSGGIEYRQVLSRIGQTRQVGTKRVQRITQLKGAFVVKNPKLIRGKNILLLDDVVTTGASLEEAARTLKSAGAKTIDAVVFAQRQ